MKKISLYISALALAAFGFSACDDNWETPPMDVPTEGADVQPTLTIAELKAMYWQDTESYGTPVTTLADGQHAIIKGTIVSSTVSGNIYKAVYVQDATGAICIGVDTADVSAVMPMGVGVAIDVTGLQIGRYSGAMQLGKADGSSVNRITYKELKPHVKLDYFGGKLDTTEVSIAQLKSLANSQGIREWGGKLVRINNVSFQEAGQDFAEGSNTSRNIMDEQGNTIIVYNSPYADFAYDTLPYGKGDIVGVLSNYRNNWQILLIDINGVIGFDGVGQPDDTPAPELPEQYKDALSVSEALEIISSGNIPTTDVMVFGRISSIDSSSFDPSYGSLIYYIMDKGGRKALEIYRGYWLNGEKFSSVNQIKVGEYIIVKGQLVNYNGTAEFTTGSQVVYYFGDADSGDANPGTEMPDAPSDVINVATALDLIANGYQGHAQVKGLISKIDDIDTGSYGNATYYIVDNIGDNQSLEVFRGYWFDGKKFTSAAQLEVGAEVIVDGELVNYNGKYEFTSGSKIISYNGMTSDPGTGDDGDDDDDIPGNTPSGDSTVETFNSSLGFPSKSAEASSTPATYTSSATGIKYTIMGCYVTGYAGEDYLMINGKNFSGAYIQFSLPSKCSEIVMATSSSCSTNAASVVNVYANGSKIGTYPANVQNSTVTVKIPVEYQAAGTIIKVESGSDNYNQQFKTFTYVQAN